MSDLSNLEIREEMADERAAVYEVNTHAFGRPEEAKLVDALRQSTYPFVSLVAVLDSSIVGHILFSPVTLDPPHRGVTLLLGLGPMGVTPEHQRKGIGSQLVRAGLKACRRIGCEAVVVLGHPEYYPRFGFAPASRYGLTCEYTVPDEVFMALELAPACLYGCRSRVKYHPAFGDV